ncbi:type VI secretion system contractile sheath small subunit (plasmid) [Pantoea dispersa]|uniref:type VI secretion system contractile sheath small subunit n=1 Tax=Pantoea dispersa TaxID=59814 RepID=UPI001CA7AB94|nr:type VI secretion system contractile sheath small subunit [Pantoea dispersa]QZY93062.1 type VI secretion system contractile sheath small subunit [Pantoea dispersa]
MAKDSSSQKFIGKNNAPRVQIEYDVELYGSQKKIELPFVTGVMSDLSGDRNKDLLPVEERKFLTFDQQNFDDRMRAIRPRLHYYVENTMAEGDALLNIELEFERMADFSPGEIARRVPQMAALLEAREHLTQLITYMDGKSSAEEVVRAILEQPDFLQKLVAEARQAAQPDNTNSDEEA